MVADANGARLARTKAAERFEGIAAELDHLPPQADDALRAGLTHWSIQAGDALADAVEQGLIDAEPSTRTWLADLKAQYQKEASVPSHLRVKRGEAEAAFLDWRARFFAGFAAKYLNAAELGSFDSRGTDHSQQRFMVGERVRLLARLCRTLAGRLAEHPALSLFRSLNELHTVCSNARLFRDLAERRTEARALRLSILNALGHAASQRANERTREGGTATEAFAEFEDVIQAASDPPPSNEPAEYTEALRGVVDNGTMWCNRAREALRAGGADGMDAALTPGTAARSTEIGVKLREAHSVFVGLLVGVDDPRFIIDTDAEAMTRLGEWFGRTRDELGAVSETRGLDAPPAPPPATAAEASALVLRGLVPDEPDDLMPATWYTKATNGTLRADTLSLASREGRLRGSKMRGKRLFHSFARVCEMYPGYQSLLTKAKQGEATPSKA